jgi:uncharacterized CHY-type Zn-finger protein
MADRPPTDATDSRPVDDPLYPPFESGRTDGASSSVEKGSERVFPCGQCGADLVFHIGQQSLRCEFCGHQQSLSPVEGEALVEHDYEAMLERIADRRSDKDQRKTEIEHYEVECGNCHAVVVFEGTLTSTFCAYCNTPLQRENAHTADNRIPADGVLPFTIERRQAEHNLKAWVKSLWFAPNAFLKQGVEGKFQGVYLPFFTFDALTYTRYSGQRGDHYYVTVGTGKDRRTVRHTRWSSASGDFRRFFDDVLVLAAKNLDRGLVLSLEPWPLGKVRPFSEAFLAGFAARTYDIELPKCGGEARQRMHATIEAQVRRLIGGDEQSIDSIQTEFSAATFKHILLPAWLLSYKYRDKVFHVFVNATTGEVQGGRPWSWVKILFAVLAGIAAAGVVVALTR